MSGEYSAQPVLVSGDGGAPGASAPQAAGGLQFSARDEQGNEQKFTTDSLMQQLRASGYQPLGASPDGMRVKLQDQQGAFELPLPELLGKLGYQMSGVSPHPDDVDYENIHAGMRMGVHKLADDAQRKEYLQQKLAGKGWKDATVVGSGRDWYAYNPDNQSWIALTNHPEWDTSDLAELGLEAPRAVAASIGGGGGALLGGGSPLSVPFAMGGAAAGGGAVDLAERGIMGLADKDYRDVATKNLGANLGDVGFNAALDGATAGLFEGAPQLAGALKPALGKAVRGVMNNGVASTATRAAGKTANTVGQVAKEGANLVNNPIGREAVSFGLPGASELNSVGWMGQLPGALARGAAKLPGAVGESRVGRALLGPERAEGLVNASKALMTRRGSTQAAEEGGRQVGNFARVVKGEKPVPRTDAGGFSDDLSDITGNAFQGAAEKVERLRNAGTLKNQKIQSYKSARKDWGMSPKEALDFGRAEEEDMAREIMNRSPLVQKSASAGERVGHYLKTAEKAGDAATAAAHQIAGGAIQGTRAAGAALQHGGKALDYLGTALAPLENRALMRYGAEEQARPDWENRYSPWRTKPNARKIRATLVEN